MAKVVLANEMGGGWGHLLPLCLIAREFIQHGCEVSLICRDRERAEIAFHGLAVALEEPPAWQLNRTGFSLNYAQNLWGNGYWDPETLDLHFKWWSERFRRLKPSFILTDYAPTALLAAMSHYIPRGAFGTGFTLPPMLTPMPSLHPWLPVSNEALLMAEERVLDSIRKYTPSLPSIADIFQGALRFLEIFPEMDHYEYRLTEKYSGPALGSASGSEVKWPEGSGSRVFIYLSSANRCLSDLIRHIKKLGLPALGYIRGLPEDYRKEMESPTLRLSGDLLDLDRAASECQIGVTQGGMHTTAKMLLAGVPLLICPEQLEQTLLGFRLQQMGLCRYVSFFSGADKAAERFDEVCQSLELKQNVRDFASKYARYDAAMTVKAIANECLDAS